jgi:hypothetical protein
VEGAGSPIRPASPNPTPSSAVFHVAGDAGTAGQPGAHPAPPSCVVSIEALGVGRLKGPENATLWALQHAALKTNLHQQNCSLLGSIFSHVSRLEPSAVVNSIPSQGGGGESGVGARQDQKRKGAKQADMRWRREGTLFNAARE